MIWTYTAHARSICFTRELYTRLCAKSYRLMMRANIMTKYTQLGALRDTLCPVLKENLRTRLSEEHSRALSSLEVLFIDKHT